VTAAAQPWAIQGRVIGALLMREILTRYGRHNIGFLWLFVEPMLFTLGVTALWTITRAAHGNAIPITAFALTGYSTVLLWRNMPGRCISAVEPNRSLLYHRHVRLLDILASRLLLEFGGATISFLVLSLLFIALGMIDPPEDLLTVIAGWSVLALFGAALALMLGGLAINNEIIEKLWHPVSYLTFPLSGAAYMVDALPRGVQPLALTLPMVNCVEMLRDGYFGRQAHAHYDMGYVLAVTVVMLAFALVTLRLKSRTIAVD
jgi:ABC-type polysaccharide/polyol phosphate export permease